MVKFDFNELNSAAKKLKKTGPILKRTSITQGSNEQQQQTPTQEQRKSILKVNDQPIVNEIKEEPRRASMSTPKRPSIQVNNGTEEKIPEEIVPMQSNPMAKRNSVINTNQPTPMLPQSISNDRQEAASSSSANVKRSSVVIPNSQPSAAPRNSILMNASSTSQLPTQKRASVTSNPSSSGVNLSHQATAPGEEIIEHKEDSPNQRSNTQSNQSHASTVPQLTKEEKWESFDSERQKIFKFFQVNHNSFSFICFSSNLSLYFF